MLSRHAGSGFGRHFFEEMIKRLQLRQAIVGKESSSNLSTFEQAVVPKL